MLPKRMTANPVRPERHRAGKPAGAVSSSESDSDDDAPEAPRLPPPPKAASAGRIISRGLGAIDLGARRQELDRAAEERREAARLAEELAAEQGFVTEDEDEDDAEGGSDQEEGDSSSCSDSSSSEEEAPRRLMTRPKFIPKSQRAGAAKALDQDQEAARLAAASATKAAATDALIEEQIKKDLAARAAGKKHWDDDENPDSDVDTTDGLDPPAEEAAWRVRELKRLRRARAAIEERERQLAEVERRRNLTAEERAAEDEAHLARQREDREAKGKMGFMQKYYHKGAFFHDEAEAAGLLQRDIMGSRIQDDVRNREALPAYLQRRDMTKLGRKGATKYRDMRSEDTGTWGLAADRGPRYYDGDERFRPDDRFRPGEGDARGANAIPLGARRHDTPRDAGGRRDGDGPRGRRASPPTRSPTPSSPSRHRRDDGGGERSSRKRSTSRERDRSHDDKRRRVDVEGHT